MFGRSLTAALTVVAVAGTALPAGAVETLSAGEIAAAIGFTEDNKNKVLAGGVVAADLPETTDKMLAQAIALLLPVKPDEVAERLRSLKLFEADQTVLAFGTIDPADPEAGLAKAMFTDGEAKEAAKSMKASPGSEFNLSAEEFAKVKAAAASGDVTPAAASKVYQDILAARVKAFAAGGIKGIAPYDRGDGQTAGAGEDRQAMAKALTFLQKEAPSLYQAVLDYPNRQAGRRRGDLHLGEADGRGSAVVRPRPSDDLQPARSARRGRARILRRPLLQRLAGRQRRLSGHRGNAGDLWQPQHHRPGRRLHERYPPFRRPRHDA